MSVLRRDTAMCSAALRALGALGALGLGACQPTAGTGLPPVRPAPPPTQHLLSDLVGEWRWTFGTSEAGTTRVEAETWQLRPSRESLNALAGRYVREVAVRSDDRVPFHCNQRPWYRQRAVFDVTVEPAAARRDARWGESAGSAGRVASRRENTSPPEAAFAVRETSYEAEPSPCDHGFRHLGGYTGELAGNRFVLRWDAGSQTLWQTASALPEIAVSPWPSTPNPLGAWRWDATSYDDSGNIRDESEWWELTRQSDIRLDATYRRRVTVRSPDNTPIACAGAPSWSFDDAYVLEGQREDEHWRFREVAADPAVHPCLQSTPRRILDEATAEQIGDYLILEWRGKRRQVLYRPEV